MEIITGSEHLEKGIRYPIVAMGNFDGLHRGHRFLIQQALDRARRKNGTSIALTFEPHPLTILSPGIDFKFLTDFKEKNFLLKEMGVDIVLCIRFTPDLASLTPEGFVERLLYNRVHLKEVVVGEDFRFGNNRAGGVKDLCHIGKQLDFEVHSVKTVYFGGSIASSSRIRERLIAGDVREAAMLLGRIYSLEGRVIPGTGRGRSLGFPTANIRPPQGRVLPADGIYLGWGFLDGHLEKGVAYVGTQPTLGRQDRAIEFHFFDRKSSLTGKSIRVGFQEWIREEEVFKDQDGLIEQIQQDVHTAKSMKTKRPMGELMILPKEKERLVQTERD